MTITIIPTERRRPHGKLADVELRFAVTGGTGGVPPHDENLDLNAEVALDGLKLVGFAVWPGYGDRPRYVTFPTRHYENEDGERRRFPLLRPRANNGAGVAASKRLKAEILKAYDDFENIAEVRLVITQRIAQADLAERYEAELPLGNEESDE